jgi:hypothetical protein
MIVFDLRLRLPLALTLDTGVAVTAALGLRRVLRAYEDRGGEEGSRRRGELGSTWSKFAV